MVDVPQLPPIIADVEEFVKKYKLRGIVLLAESAEHPGQWTSIRKIVDVFGTIGFMEATKATLIKEADSGKHSEDFHRGDRGLVVRSNGPGMVS